MCAALHVCISRWPEQLSLGQLVWVTPPQVTNYPKFLRQIELCGRSDITHMVERQVDFPEDLQDFFEKNPEVRSLFCISCTWKQMSYTQ